MTYCNKLYYTIIVRNQKMYFIKKSLNKKLYISTTKDAVPYKIYNKILK